MSPSFAPRAGTGPEHDHEEARGGGVTTSWQRWMEDVEWSDWRTFLQRIASTDWASIDWTAAEWEARPWPAPGQAAQVSLTMRAFAEDEPGDQICEHLTAVWPAFRQWWREG